MLRTPPLPEPSPDGPGPDEPIEPAPASPGSVRSARRLLRRKDRLQVGRFLAEGRQAVAEALARPGTVIEVLVSTDAVTAHQDLLNTADAVRHTGRRGLGP